jgi:hypothetical protein
MAHTDVTVRVYDDNIDSISAWLKFKKSKVILGGPYMTPPKTSYFADEFSTLAPYGKRSGMNMTFRFENKQDALLFKLTFG